MLSAVLLADAAMCTADAARMGYVLDQALVLIMYSGKRSLIYYIH